MKKIQIPIILLLSTVICACEKDSQAEQEQNNTKDLKQELIFQGTVNHRQDDSEEFFYNGNKVGVFVTTSSNGLSESENYLHNVVFRKEGPSFIPDAGHQYNYPAGQFDLITYYPYVADLESVTTQKFEVALDQSTSIMESDVLYAKATGLSQSTQDLSVEFNHLMSKLRIKLIKGTGVNGLEEIMPVLHNTCYRITVNLSDGSSHTENVTTDIISYRQSETLREVILPAQTIVRGSAVTIRDGDEPLVWTLEEDIEFLPNKVKVVEITVFTNRLEVEISGDIENWEADESPIKEEL